MNNKYEYVKVIQGNYGLGWEDLCEYDKHDKQIYKDIKEYRICSPNYPHRIINRRNLILKG